MRELWLDPGPLDFHAVAAADLPHGVGIVSFFFYGLFMDESLLAARGIEPSEIALGFVDGYDLCIGERATLVRRSGGRAYGTVMEISKLEAAELYAEESVADYLPESLIVELMDGTKVEATCYILPRDSVAGANKQYAESLLALASRLGFPESYLEQIRRALA